MSTNVPDEADDPIDRLRLLASALAGRTVEVAVVEPDTPAWTDGTTVFLDRAAPPAEQLAALAVQASLVAAGSLEPTIVRRLVRRPAVARRYLMLEGHRALAANEAVLPPSVRPLVDREIASRVDDAAGSLTEASGRRPVPDPPPSFGVLRPRGILASADGPDAPLGDAERSRPPTASTTSELADEDSDDDDPRRLGSLLSSPVGGRGPVGRLLARMLTPSREPVGAGPVGADTPTHHGRAARRAGVTGVRFPGAAAPSADFADAPHRGTRYPEWDVDRRRYRPDWCTVVTVEPGAEHGSPLAMPDGLALTRSLARLGMGLTPCHRRPQGDDIDIDALVEARVLAASGSAPDEDVYLEAMRRRRDLAVLVLLDVSGSAGEQGPRGKTVHEHQVAAAGALTAALARLGDRVALDAFNSRGRTAVQIQALKGFDDPLDSRLARRLAGLVPGAYTRLGAAIRHAAARLDAGGGTPRRLLVVLSDGFAYDVGYEGRYGEADARRALVEARRLGLGCLCLSVGASTPPVALRRVFGTAAHAAVPTADELPGVVGPLFRAALRSAEVQRRAFQREGRTRERLALEGTPA